jgi:hypothetical protein
MASDGYFSGLIFDLADSYRIAFLNGVLWNAFNFAFRRLTLLAPPTARSGGRIRRPGCLATFLRRQTG